jgi:hypothetical protein
MPSPTPGRDKLVLSVAKYRALTPPTSFVHFHNKPPYLTSCITYMVF